MSDAGLHRQRHRRRARRQGRDLAGDAAPHPCADGSRQRKPRDEAASVRIRAADTVDEAMELLAEYGDDARILAGGQSLMPMLNLRLIEPAVLIDIRGIAALGDIRELGGKIEIGAAVTQNRLMAWPQPQRKAAAARRGAAVRRPFPDPQQGHRLRLDRACRSELGNSAVARRAAAARWCCVRESAAARTARGRRVPAGHADHGARRRGIGHGRALSGHGRAAASPSARWRAGTAISP